MLLRLWLTAIVLLLALPLQAAADDTKALSARVDAYALAMQTKSYEGIIAVVPQRILTLMASYSDTDVATLRSAMIQQTQQTIATIDVLELEIETADPDFRTTSTGIAYAFLPTSSLMAIPGIGKVESSTSTLALKDDGAWYLSSIDAPQQIALIREAYPGFNSIDFPTGSSKPVD